MVTLKIDAALNADLERVSKSKERPKAEVVTEALQQYILTEQRRQLSLDPALITLYQQLAEEDVALAEAGMADYVRQLAKTDGA